LQRVAVLQLHENTAGQRGSNRPSVVAVDHTSSFLAVGDCCGCVRVWDVSQTSGTTLAKNHQDSSGRPPASVSLVSWFKAHARRLSFIAFTSTCDIVTASSGVCVRVWSVTGAAIGKVGRPFLSIPLEKRHVARFSIGCEEGPEESTRGAAEEDDDYGDSIVKAGGENKGGKVEPPPEDIAEDDGPCDDVKDHVDLMSAAAFGQMSSQVIKLQRQRHEKPIIRCVSFHFLCILHDAFLFAARSIHPTTLFPWSSCSLFGYISLPTHQYFHCAQPNDIFPHASLAAAHTIFSRHVTLFFRISPSCRTALLPRLTLPPPQSLFV
jgi:hypothetical protein